MARSPRRAGRPADPADPANCTCFGLRRAARAVTQRFDRALAPSGLRATQLTLLQVLASAAPLPLTRLSDRLGMDRTTLTRNLAPLERDGLVRLDPGADARAREARLTPAGRRALERGLRAWNRVQRQIVRRMGTRSWSRLLEGLDAAIEASREG